MSIQDRVQGGLTLGLNHFQGEFPAILDQVSSRLAAVLNRLDGQFAPLVHDCRPPEATGKPSLWLFRPDGSRRVRITEDPNWFDVHPAFSPHGRRIAFVRTRPLGSGSAVWVCAADGTRARQLVAGASAAERFFSPVWLSDTQLVYVRDPKIDRQPDMELWQVDADQGIAERVLGFDDLLPGRGAIVTDASPDRSTLLVAAQRGVFWATADVYLLDWYAHSVRPLWQDPAGDHKDARPLWSPTARAIAWHHNFTSGSLAKVISYGVAIARQDAGDSWNVEFQPDQQTFVTPLAWSPDGHQLLCARRGANAAKTQQPQDQDLPLDCRDVNPACIIRRAAG